MVRDCFQSLITGNHWFVPCCTFSVFLFLLEMCILVGVVFLNYGNNSAIMWSFSPFGVTELKYQIVDLASVCLQYLNISNNL